ncbi:DUF1127 domain-containing protein [Polymorphum gilvum]|uniref:YjiS-like domain-containing protein n=1 Tax=Polymorphum gilvum (strain LMG 25793 / CGMCC 1.9160 / SL003B-26A1) TaxID=991905 RepID=F2J0W4_POLGS|nr:DUF1127 domain-containing protein [Polymorphum gilvum]ADZ71910.1 hypothetical protein SL003B_3488 [Polymorphum gilvum SL003B-26A1]
MSAPVSPPLIGRIAGFVARTWRAMSFRREIAELATWTDSQLDDIGLTRADVRRALREPLFSDPSRVLRNSVGERRLARDEPALNVVVLPAAADRPATRRGPQLAA